jgi:acyl carrier protein
VDQAILATVVETMREIFLNKNMSPPPLSAESPLDNTLGLDSMDFAELVVRLEDKFGFDPFACGTPPRLQKMGDLVEFYQKRP